MTVRSFLLDDLDIRWDRIWTESGHRGFVPDSSMSGIFREVMDDVRDICRPEYCFSRFRRSGGTGDTVSIDGKVFNTGERITGYLEDADTFVLYIGTAGVGFEEYQRRLEKEGDIVKSFFADIIGSAVAEHISMLAYEDISSALSGEGLKVTYSYSPGYCGWPVSDQKTFFSFFPPSPCGVSLTGSGLMVPVKSVSGLAGAGLNVRKGLHGCAICDKDDCFRKSIWK